MLSIKTLIARRAAMGFTLIEALIAAVILAAAVGAMVAPMSATYIQTRTIQQTNIALSMAQQLLDEVVSRHYADPTDASVVTLGPDSAESGRATFDNMDDYHGYQDSTDPSASNAMKTISGDAIDWKTTDVYRRSVTVEYRNTPAGPAVAAGDFILISVEVTMPTGQKLSVARLIAKYPRGA
jgi:Tfp pilus assembly protein PilV